MLEKTEKMCFTLNNIEEDAQDIITSYFHQGYI